MGPLSFLTPLAALVAVAGILPLLAFLRRERRARHVREALGLGEPPIGPRRRIVAALVAVPALAGLAAAQPVIDRSKSRAARADAEVFFVVDTSKSMIASAGLEEPTRIDRARATALEIRNRLPGVPAGLASLTNRTLPHLFPTIDERSFAATLHKSIGIERPGPTVSSLLATELTTLEAVARYRFFLPAARKRLVVVLTDGETQPVKPRLAGALREARVATIFVHVWSADERIFLTTAPDPYYRPDPSSRRVLAQTADLVGGAAFAEDDVEGIVARAQAELGDGPTRPRSQRDLLAFMPWVTLAAFFPLGFVLLRRNV